MSDQPAAPQDSSKTAAPAPNASSTNRQRASQLAQALRLELQKAVIGQNAVIDDLLTALIAGGHVLVEGVPGLGKTLLVRALARCFGGEFARIQFTPDLMPSDVTGHAVYDLQTEHADGRAQQRVARLARREQQAAQAEAIETEHAEETGI